MTAYLKQAGYYELTVRYPPARGRRRERLQGAGLDLALPYLLLAPGVLHRARRAGLPAVGRPPGEHEVLSLRQAAARASASTTTSRLWDDPQFTQLALDDGQASCRCRSPSRRCSGLALALFCLREFRGIRLLRTVLIVPMVITPVVVAIVFRLIYASDAGMLTAFSEALGGGPIEILGHPGRAFLGLVALDVWEWTPLMFLILLAGLQSLPVEPFEAARVDGAGAWRTFVDHTLPMLRPVLAIAIVLRTIDAFGTFDQVFVLTHGGPGEATKLLSIYGYDTSFKFQQTGYAAALLRHHGPDRAGVGARGGAAAAPDATRHDRRGSDARVVVALLLLIVLLPIYWMVATSLKSNQEITQDGTLYPHAPTLDNYRHLFSQKQFGAYLTNSLAVTAALGPAGAGRRLARRLCHRPLPSALPARAHGRARRC